MNKKYLLVVVSLLFAISIAFIPAQAATPSIMLNGQALQSDTPPMIEEGSTLVPMRAIFEALGAQVTWDGSTKTVMAVKGNTTLELAIGGDVKVNGQKLDINAQAKVYDGSTMVPLRFVGESLGAKVGWNPDTKTITITTATETTEPKEAAVEEEAGTETETPDTTPVEEEAADTEKDTAPADDTQPAGDTEKVPFELYLDSLNARFMPEKAQGVSITYQFVINKGNEGNYYVVINDGEISTGAGTADNPTVTIAVGEQLWLDIASGKEDGTMAYFTGKFQVDGDPTYVSKLKEFFQSTE